MCSPSPSGCPRPSIGWAARPSRGTDEPTVDLSSNGFTVATLQAAWRAVVRTPVPDEVPERHLRAALEAAVRFGDDTDTVAAVAGALLGAFWGVRAIPAHLWRIVHGWPGLRLRDLADLGSCIVSGGGDASMFDGTVRMVYLGAGPLGG